MPHVAEGKVSISYFLTYYRVRLNTWYFVVVALFNLKCTPFFALDRNKTSDFPI